MKQPWIGGKSSIYTRKTLKIFVDAVEIAAQARNDRDFYLSINFRFAPTLLHLFQKYF